MAKMKGGGDAFDDMFGNRGPYSDVTRENYYELARRSPHCIAVREGEASWQAWLVYLDGLGIPTAYARKIGSMTVPAAWPSGFDLNAPPSPPPMPPPGSRSTPGIDRRRELIGMVRDIADRSGRDKPGKGFVKLDELREAYAARPKPFTLPVHEERPMYADKPPVATPAMREYLGRWIEPEPRADDDGSVF